MPNLTSNSGIRDNHRCGDDEDFLEATIQPQRYRLFIHSLSRQTLEENKTMEEATN